MTPQEQTPEVITAACRQSAELSVLPGNSAEQVFDLDRLKKKQRTAAGRQ
jgi:hypothetical protein